MAWVMSSWSAEDWDRQEGPDNYGDYVKCRHEQQQKRGSDGVCRWKDSGGAKEIANAGSEQHQSRQGAGHPGSVSHDLILH